MSQGREIAFGNGMRCTLDLNATSTRPATDPELTVAKYPVHGLPRGEVDVLVTRTQVPAIVRVELAEHRTGLNAGELEQIRERAEAIFRTQSQ